MTLTQTLVAYASTTGIEIGVNDESGCLLEVFAMIPADLTADETSAAHLDAKDIDDHKATDALYAAGYAIADPAHTSWNTDGVNGLMVDVEKL